jgi:hypothetical protein
MKWMGFPNSASEEKLSLAAFQGLLVCLLREQLYCRARSAFEYLPLRVEG